MHLPPFQMQNSFSFHQYLQTAHRVPGPCWVMVATVPDTPDWVSWSLISGAMSLCLYLSWLKSYSFFNLNHLLLPSSGPLSTWPNHSKSRYQTTTDSLYSPEPPEIPQTSSFLRRLIPPHLFVPAETTVKTLLTVPPPRLSADWPWWPRPRGMAYPLLLGTVSNELSFQWL